VVAIEADGIVGLGGGFLGHGQLLRIVEERTEAAAHAIGRQTPAATTAYKRPGLFVSRRTLGLFRRVNRSLPILETGVVLSPWCRISSPERWTADTKIPQGLRGAVVPLYEVVFLVCDGREAFVKPVMRPPRAARVAACRHSMRLYVAPDAQVLAVARRGPASTLSKPNSRTGLQLRVAGRGQNRGGNQSS
jgi:hypothetical protein